MAQNVAEIKERFILRIEPSLIERCQRVANARFGGNKSLVIRTALDRFLVEKEDELGLKPESERAA